MSLFTENKTYIGGGLVTFYNPKVSSADVLPHSVAIINCTFAGNTGQYDGALSNVQLGYLNVLNVKNCTFIENNGLLGAVLYLQFLFTALNFVAEKEIVIKDWYTVTLCLLYLIHFLYIMYTMFCTTIWNNTAMHEALFATRNTIRIQGNTLFKENTGPAIQVDIPIDRDDCDNDYHCAWPLHT